MEDWAEIRRLHRAEGVSISEIARRMGLARNTVKAALRSERPPRYERPARGSLADAAEPAVRVLLADHPRMPATVIDSGQDILPSGGHLISPLAATKSPRARPRFLPG